MCSDLHTWLLKLEDILRLIPEKKYASLYLAIVAIASVAGHWTRKDLFA
jgi:hypothetical protein